MMLYLRAARRREDRQLGRLAVVTHGAVAEAIVNTWGGKAGPEFGSMIARLIGANKEQSQQSAMPNASVLNKMASTAGDQPGQPPSFAESTPSSLDGMKSF